MNGATPPPHPFPATPGAPISHGIFTTMDRALSALQAALTAREVYWAEHAAAVASVRAAADALAVCLRLQDSIDVMFLADRVICGDRELPSGPGLAKSLGTRLRARGAECVSFSRGIEPAEISGFLDALSRRGGTEPPSSPHIRCGSLQVSGGLGTGSAATRDGPAGRIGGHGGGVLEPRSQHPEHIRDLWHSVQTGTSLGTDRIEETVAGLLGLLAATGGASIPLAALKSHDEYTFVHTTNVAILSGALAETVGLSQRRVRDVTIAAVLHDVGKERVPPAILNKAGKLNDEELRVMRQHPVDGAKMLASSPDVPDVAVIVAYEHHVHPDGTGYPVLGPGRRMHLSSRIVQLADVYDALATNRPYRAALPPEQIREIMTAKVGRVYDPDLLSAFFHGVVNRVDKAGAAVAGRIGSTDRAAA